MSKRRLRVLVDERERSSGVPEALKGLGVLVEYRMLDVGDYVAPGYAFERKEVHDLVRSVFSGRVFDQARRLVEAYEHPILIVEGDVGSILGVRIRPTAYWGALASLTIDYGLRILFTPDSCLLYTSPSPRD